jgi:hypothetical protein
LQLSLFLNPRYTQHTAHSTRNTVARRIIQAILLLSLIILAHHIRCGAVPTTNKSLSLPSVNAGMFIFFGLFFLAASHERWNTTHTHAPNPLLPRTRDIAQARLEHQDQLISTLSETVGGKTREIADLHVSEHTKHAHVTRMPSHQQHHTTSCLCSKNVSHTPTHAL